MELRKATMSMRGSLVFVIALAFSCLCAADGLIVVDDPAMAQIRPEAPFRFAPLDVREHHVTVRINDQLAETRIDQVFFNPTKHRLEGTYMFPLPVGAHLDDFAMEVNGKMVSAELVDAAKARRIYEDIVRRMRDPALLEYVGAGMLKARIFPIEPGSEKRVEIRYSQVLTADGGLIEYRYPLGTERFSARELDSVSVAIELECSRALRTVYSPSHQVEIRRHGSHRATVGFEASHLRPDTDLELLYSMGEPSGVGLDLITHTDGRDGAGYFMLLATPGVNLDATEVMAKDVVFVLDTSGSMADRGKLDQARRALGFCLRNLDSRDRFEVIRFSTEAEALFGELRPARADALDEALAFLEQLKPRGGTAIEDALALALEPARDHDGPTDVGHGRPRGGAGSENERPYMVVFLTDGRPTVGDTDTDRLVQTVIDAVGSRSVRIFCFGVGTDVNTHLLDRVSEQTRAATQYVLPEEDLELKVSSFYSKISSPVLASPRLRAGRGVRLLELEPSRLPDLYRGEQLVVLGRFEGRGSAELTLEGTVNGRPHRVRSVVAFDRDAHNELVPLLWATRRVGSLLDQVRLNGDDPELRDEIVRLARRYGVLTPYTAHLIVEDEARRGVSPASRSLQEIDRERALRDEGGRLYEELRVTTSGEAAVGGAQSTRALKDSTVASMAREATKLALRGQASAPSVAKKMIEAVGSQQHRYLGGRTFYRNGDRWIDAEVARSPDAQRHRITFGSDAYFRLLDEHPEAAKWLALGSRVELVLGNAIYEIVASEQPLE